MTTQPPSPSQQPQQPQQAWTPPPHEAWTPADHSWQQPPPPRRGGGRIAIVVILLLVGILVIAVAAFVFMLANGFGALGSRTPIGEVAVGECFDGLTAGSAEDEIGGSQLALLLGVLVVDCAEPHDAELVGRFDWTGGEAFPGAAAVERHSEQGCRERFRQYVGTDFELSTLELTYTHPVEAQWRAGVRTFECIALAPAGEDKLVGSVRDSRR